MGAIAVGRVAGALAVTKPDFLVLGEGEFHRRFAGAFVAAVTHGLMTAESAGAPPVVASFEFERDGHGSEEVRSEK